MILLALLISLPQLVNEAREYGMVLVPEERVVEWVFERPVIGSPVNKWIIELEVEIETFPMPLQWAWAAPGRFRVVLPEGTLTARVRAAGEGVGGRGEFSEWSDTYTREKQ